MHAAQWHSRQLWSLKIPGIRVPWSQLLSLNALQISSTYCTFFLAVKTGHLVGWVYEIPPSLNECVF